MSTQFLIQIQFSEAHIKYENGKSAIKIFINLKIRAQHNKFLAKYESEMTKQ